MNVAVGKVDVNETDLLDAFRVAPTIQGLMQLNPVSLDVLKRIRTKPHQKVTYPINEQRHSSLNAACLIFMASKINGHKGTGRSQSSELISQLDIESRAKAGGGPQ